MKKFFTSAILLFPLFLFACSNARTENDLFSRTAEQASQLAVKNAKYDLNKFITGTWEGECSKADRSKESLAFQDNARLKVTTYMPPDFTDYKSGYEQGLYEILDEKNIKLFYLAAGEIIEINKLNEDEIKIGGTGSTIIYGCILRRRKS